MSSNPTHISAVILAAHAAIAPSPQEHRSTAKHTLTQDDRAHLAELGLRPLHAGAISVRPIASSRRAAHLDRLRELGRAPAQLAASEICDELAPLSDGTAVCTGRTDGPMGQVRVRMTIATRLEDRGDGRVSFVVFNTRPLEAKSLFGWTELAKANGVKFSLDLEPTEDHWTETTRMGVTMSSHVDASERLGEKLVKLDRWLASDLAAR